MESSKSYRLNFIIKGELVIKKTFILLPIILLLTACTGNKDIQIDDNKKVEEKKAPERAPGYGTFYSSPMTL